MPSVENHIAANKACAKDAKVHAIYKTICADIATLNKSDFLTKWLKQNKLTKNPAEISDTIQLTKSTAWGVYCAEQAKQSTDEKLNRSKAATNWNKMSREQKMCYQQKAKDISMAKLVTWRAAMNNMTCKTPDAILAEIHTPIMKMKKKELYVHLGHLGCANDIDTSTTIDDLQELLITTLWGENLKIKVFGDHLRLVKTKMISKTKNPSLSDDDDENYSETLSNGSIVLGTDDDDDDDADGSAEDAAAADKSLLKRKQGVLEPVQDSLTKRRKKGFKDFARKWNDITKLERRKKSQLQDFLKKYEIPFDDNHTKPQLIELFMMHMSD